MNDKTYDIAIVGGGIVGLATAMSLARDRALSLIVIEAESRLAAHQTGNNSGVIHAGLYYKPGSLKARNCVEGRELMYRFCQEHGLPHERCGKVVVATRSEELSRLDELERRGAANGLAGIERLDAAEVREREPHVEALAGLWIPMTGIIDYAAVARKFAEIVVAAGGVVEKSTRLTSVDRRADELVLETTRGEVRCRHLINCAGLQSDRVARMCGVDPGVRVIPFRGEFYKLIPAREHLVRNLIYPTPDPRFPFLGVHFTRLVHGGVEAGPNAVLALARHGYRWRDVSPADMINTLGYPGFWRLAARFWKTGLGETYRSLSKRAFVAGLQRLVPEVRAEDLEPAGAGVRAQAVDRQGALVDDFWMVEAERMIHVLNAPSPAATASISVGRTIAELAAKNFDLAATPAV